MPGTDRWKPVAQESEDSDDEDNNNKQDQDQTEDGAGTGQSSTNEVVQDNGMVGSEETPGVLIVRVRDDLDFGMSRAISQQSAP